MRSAAGRCYGRTDLPLEPGWQTLLPELVASLVSAAPGLVRTSPLQRCRLPATALAERLGVPLHVDPRLVELDFGRWEGLDWDQVPRAALDLWAADPAGFAAPGGETGAALLARMKGVLADLARDAVGSLVVSHGGPLRLLGRMLRGLEPDLLAPPPACGMLQIVALPAVRTAASPAR